MSFLPGLRRAALKLPAARFTCRQCLLRQQPPAAPSRSRILRLVRYQSTAASVAEPLSNLGSKSGAEAGAKKARWPEQNPKVVGYWLLGSAASVFGIVVFGGLTRLTESGLSITEWKPVTGSLPPLSQEAWESEFEKYRASPEFHMLNSSMNLEEFKRIYFMEWTHRLWGRFIGLSFVIPTVYLIARRRVTKPMAWNLVGISGLIGFQGFIGWWMVASGLVDDLFKPGSHPRVSQYRLTTHLATAVACYTWMIWVGLNALRTRRFLADPKAAMKTIDALKNPALKPFKRNVAGLAVLVLITLLSGGLVAGLDAGLIYNEFPKMGLGLTPPKSELWDKFYSRKEDGSDLWWRNMLENPSLVQLDHRILATTTFCAVLALFAYSRRGRVSPALTRELKKGTTGCVHLANMQVALGLGTLLYMVPVWLAAAHQAGALALFTGVLVLAHRLRVPKPVIAQVQRQLKIAAQAAAR